MSNQTIRILSFDPSITAMGWSLICFNLSDGSSVVTKRGLLTGRQVLKERKALQEKFSKPYVTLDAFYYIFCQMFDEHLPHYVVTEGAFYYRFAQAYASLTLVIHTLRRACHAKLGYDLHEVAPMETKKLVTGNHMADKDQIKAALLVRPGLTITESEKDPPEEISEHEYDAIGHGLTFIHKVLPVLLDIPVPV